MSSDRVKHRGKPAEPFAQAGAQGRITRTAEDGRLRITPAYRGSPAMAHCEWEHEVHGTFHTWERLQDLQVLGKPRKQ